MDELRSLVSTYSPHLICLCETWLDDSIIDDELYIPTFSLVCRDRNRNGGDVAFFIHNSIPYKVLMHHQHIELLVLELTLNNCNLLCALLYRPPSSDLTVLSHLEDTLDALPPNKTNTMVLLGDFNIDLTTHTNDPQLVSLQAKHGLTQIISSLTRTMQSSATIIDHVYVSEHLHSIMSPISSSDHSCVLLSLLNRRVLPTKPCQHKVWLYQHADFDAANDTLIDSPFEPSSSNSVDSVWN